MMQFAVLLVCVLGVSTAFPLVRPLSPSAPGNTVLVPVTVLTSLGPQVVLMPVSAAEWNAQKNPSPTPQSVQTHTFTQPQHQVRGETAVEGENVNSPFLQPNTPPEPSNTLPLAPDTAQPQGQVFPVWNSLPVFPLQPSLTGQTVYPSVLTPTGGVGGQTQMVSVVRQVALSNSESSEEGDTTQVIYLLPVSAEIPNMGIAEGGQTGTDPTDPNIDPNLGHLQLTTPSPTPLAGLQESPAPLDTAAPPTERPVAGVQQPPAEGSTGSRTGTPAGTANPCPQKGKRASIPAKRPLP